MLPVHEDDQDLILGQAAPLSISTHPTNAAAPPGRCLCAATPLPPPDRATLCRHRLPPSRRRTAQPPDPPDRARLVYSREPPGEASANTLTVGPRHS